MAANLNNATAVPISRSDSQLSNTADIKEVLTAMEDSWVDIGKTYDNLHDQSVKLATLSPTLPKTTQEIQILRDEIRSRTKENDDAIKEMKNSVEVEVKRQINSQMKGLQADITAKIKSEIKRQVSEQVDVQIKEHLPVTLKDQLDESKKQLEVVNSSLKNSEARRKNSALRVPRDLDELLTDAATPDGGVSAFFPNDLRALFAYDLEQSQSLARDYRLPVSKIKTENLNSFMSHIGIRFQLEVFSS